MLVVPDSLTCYYLVMGSCAEHIAGLAGCVGCAGCAGHFGFIIDLVKACARGAGCAGSAGPGGFFDLCFNSQSKLSSE